MSAHDNIDRMGKKPIGPESVMNVCRFAARWNELEGQERETARKLALRVVTEGKVNHLLHETQREVLAGMLRGEQVKKSHANLVRDAIAKLAAKSDGKPGE